MPDTTDNYGLRFPLDSDSIDTAGDIQRLAEDVDAALPRITYGTGRPDSPAIAGSEGDKYICTNPSGNNGAREWKYTGSKWVCVEGTTPKWAFNITDVNCNIRTWRDGTTWFLIAYWNSSARNRVGTQCRNVESWVGSGTYAAYGGGPSSGHSTCGIVAWHHPSQTGGGAGRGDILVLANGSYGDVRRTISWTAGDGWPSTGPSGAFVLGSPEHLEYLEDELRKAADENPELADQLKAELEALRSEDG